MERPNTPPPAAAPEKVAKARAFCEELLRRMGALVDLEVRESPEAIGVWVKPLEGNRVEFNSALIEAVQALANRAVNPLADVRKWVNLEVGGYSEAGDPAVKAMAARLAETVRRTGQVVALAPMSPRERRQLHIALQDAEGVNTRSEGEGLFRQLLVFPDPAKRVVRDDAPGEGH
jgi:spoIIIJ-associated protein